jgi:hypothetical protein
MYDAFFLLREMTFQKFAVVSKEFLMYLQQNGVRKRQPTNADTDTYKMQMKNITVLVVV